MSESECEFYGLLNVITLWTFGFTSLLPVFENFGLFINETPLYFMYFRGKLKKKINNIFNTIKKYKTFSKLKVTDSTNTVETSYIRTQLNSYNKYFKWI